MKWYQLTEEELDITDSEDIMAFIQQNCQPYIKEHPDFMSYPLYRGMSPRGDVSIQTIRQDRKPLSSNQYIHQVYDEAMKRAGLTAIRSNSIFCTGNKNAAMGYGDVYVIFPIGDFKYSYTTEYRDLYTAFGRIARRGFFRFKNINTILTRVEAKKLTNDDLPSDITEISLKDLNENFKLDWYKIYDLIDSNEESLVDKLEIDIDHLAEGFKKIYRTDKIDDAIWNNTEIMITGDKYLALKHHVYMDMLEDLS